MFLFNNTRVDVDRVGVFDSMKLRQYYFRHHICNEIYYHHTTEKIVGKWLT